MESTLVQVNTFLTYTIGIVVFFVGMRVNDRIAFLRTFNIPEPVTGGILAAVVVLLLYLAFGVSLEFDLKTRDLLLVYFFTTIGINASIRDLISGGKPLLIFLVLTLVYIVIQDLSGLLTAGAIGEPGAMGVLVGSASLVGGHGTVIAWAPDISADYGIANALEVGVATATFGLIIAGLIGGPIAMFLLRGSTVKGGSGERLLVGIPHDREDSEQINHVSVMNVILVIHIAIIFGYFLDQGFAEIGLKLPLFVSCLLVAIVMSNSVPLVMPRLRWPARTRALAVVSDFSLGLFIAMSLMGMQLWEMADLAGPLLVILLVQVLVLVAYIVFLVFPLMGRDYLATVLSSGFAGFGLGATPTAIANMTAVTKTHGPAPQAFIILPLVGAFFVDIANAFVMRFFLGLNIF
ncbi:MAG: sodium/glutamate symporter [Kiloniellales bacterium]